MFVQLFFFRPQQDDTYSKSPLTSAIDKNVRDLHDTNNNVVMSNPSTKNFFEKMWETAESVGVISASMHADASNTPGAKTLGMKIGFSG